MADVSRENLLRKNAALKLRSPNSGPLSLKYAAPNNASFLMYETWVAEQVRDVYDTVTRGLPELDLIKKDLLSKLIAEWDRLDGMKQEDFERQKRLNSSERTLISTSKERCSSDCEETNCEQETMPIYPSVRARTSWRFAI